MNEAALMLARGELPADFKCCCASIYESPAVRWLLGGELHPGGEALTLRAAELTGVRAGDRVLDVASGAGASALLLARRIGCEVVGLDYGAEAVASAAGTARATGLAERVSFVRGDAESLPFADATFDAVFCECSLCLFPDKQAAVAEMRRVLRPRGAISVSDVTAEPGLLPTELKGLGAQVACVAAALPAHGYETLLGDAGFDPISTEPHPKELAALVDRVEARLRLARMERGPRLEPLRPTLDQAIELARLARDAIADGALGYAIFTGRVASAVRRRDASRQTLWRKFSPTSLSSRWASMLS